MPNPTSVTVTVTLVIAGVTTTYASTLSPGAIAALATVVASPVRVMKPNASASPAPVDIGDLISQHIAEMALLAAMSNCAASQDQGVIAANAVVASAISAKTAAVATAQTNLQKAITQSAGVTTTKTSAGTALS